MSAELQAELVTLRQTISDKDAIIFDLETRLTHCIADMKKMTGYIDKITDRFRIQNEQVTAGIKGFSHLIESKDETIRQLEEQLVHRN